MCDKKKRTLELIVHRLDVGNGWTRIPYDLPLRKYNIGCASLEYVFVYGWILFAFPMRKNELNLDFSVSLDDMQLFTYCIILRFPPKYTVHGRAV